jgi:hypothetical protein
MDRDRGAGRESTNGRDARANATLGDVWSRWPARARDGIWPAAQKIEEQAHWFDIRVKK